MTMRADVEDGFRTLTEREKQTLRLIVRGHDAKSIARSLDLSVHTINERLRDARRKLAVSSSREAARLLFAAEEGAIAPIPQSSGDEEMGEDAGSKQADQEGASHGDAGRRHRPLLLPGVIVMTLVFSLLALTGLPQPISADRQPPAATEVVDAAKRFLELVDQGRWEDSYRATATVFHHLNTVQTWAAVSEKVRTPLGPVRSRTLLSHEEVPAPPHGYDMVKFRTSFANRQEDAVETVTLDREGGTWRVVGVTID